MITEQENEKLKVEKLSNGIRICEEAISKSEKYERLSENADWKAFCDDLLILAGLHEREIQMGISMLPDAPSQPYVKRSEAGHETVVSSKSDWTDFIMRHEIQRQELVNWVKEPARILAMAAEARSRLPLLKDALAKTAHDQPNGSVRGTGKS